MTPEQLAAIAARNAARTQGKWTHTTYLSGTQNVEFPGSRGVAVVNSVNDHDNKPIANSVLCLPPTHMAVSQRLEDYGRDDDHQRFHNGQFIAHASEDIPSLLAEVARLTAVIEHDRSKVVDVLAEANAVLKNYGWLAEGRGSYAFDDDRWKDEFKVCMDSLAKVLDPMRGIASDLSDSPIKWADIVAARSMTDALARQSSIHRV